MSKSGDVLGLCRLCGEAVFSTEPFTARQNKWGKTEYCHDNREEKYCSLAGLKTKFALMKRQYALLTGHEYEAPPQPPRYH